MLFSTSEYEKLDSLKKVALALNTYELIFNSNSSLQNLISNFHIDINHYLSSFKTVIWDLDKFVKNDNNDHKLLFSYIGSLEMNLNGNLYAIEKIGGDYYSYLKNFFYELYWFLSRLNDWRNKYSSSSNPNAGLISNRNHFQSLYANIDNLLKTQFVSNSEVIENINYQNFKNRLDSFESELNSISNKFIVFNEEYRVHKNENFTQQQRLFEERANDAFFSYQASLNDLTKKYQEEFEPQLKELNKNLSTNKSELDALLGDVKLYQDKMTNKAVAEMSSHYFDKSKFERNSYFAITLVSAIIIIFSVISAYIGVNSYYNEYVSTKSCDSSQSRTIKINGAIKEMSFEECMKDLSVKREATQKYAFNYLIFRLSFSLLLFLAVIYASRIAMRAYNHWRQSENMYLKLNTLSPFIGSLDKSVRNDVHLSLVPDYFGKDAGMVENSKDAVKDLPTNISNIAIKAIEQAGTTIGSKLGSDRESKNSDSESSTEKNKKKSEDESQ